MVLLSLSPRACPRHQVGTSLRPYNLPRIPGNYMLLLPSPVLLAVEHRRIPRLQHPSLTGYMLTDLKLLPCHRFYLLLFLIDGLVPKSSFVCLL